jgi:hypothetical protein
MLETPWGDAIKGIQRCVVHDPNNLWVIRPNTQEKIAEYD